MEIDLLSYHFLSFPLPPLSVSLSTSSLPFSLFLYLWYNYLGQVAAKMDGDKELSGRKRVTGNQTSGWDKFLLLMWKNWTSQKRHKVQIIVEIVLPVVFVSLLVIIRELATITPHDPVYYETLTIGPKLPCDLRHNCKVRYLHRICSSTFIRAVNTCKCSNRRTQMDWMRSSAGGLSLGHPTNR